MEFDSPVSAASPDRKRNPRLPWPLAAPFSLLSDSLHSRLLVTTLNRLLDEALRDGELDFLQGRRVVVRVRDINVTWRLSLTGNRLVVDRRPGSGDLTIEATLYDFLVLIGRQEDPDTLVFQRRLLMKGDTELGLQLKNFLDALDVESVGWYRRPAAVLRKALPVYARLFDH